MACFFNLLKGYDVLHLMGASDRVGIFQVWSDLCLINVKERLLNQNIGDNNNNKLYM